MIDDITVLAEKRCPDFSIGIRFRSGKHEHLLLKKNLPYGDRRKHTDNTVSRIRELAAVMDDFEIADQLNQEGLTTPEGKTFTYAGIRWLRYKYDIFTIAGGNISKHRWEVCSMKSPWVFLMEQDSIPSQTLFCQQHILHPAH